MTTETIIHNPKPQRPAAERLGTWFAAISGGAIMALIYLPVLWLALMSISAEPLSGMPGGFTLEWYQALFARPSWLNPLLASLGLGLCVAVSCALAGLVVARAIPKMKRGGPTLMLFLVPLFVPGILIGVAIFIYFRVMLGLRLGWWSLFVAHFTWAYPFSLLALLVTTLRFDVSLRDAAGDLGATPWQAFRDVELPIILPGVVAAGLFGFLMSFNELSRSLLLRGTATTLPLYEWAQASAHQSNVPVIFSLSTIIMLCSMAIIGFAFYLLFGRKR